MFVIKKKRFAIIMVAIFLFGGALSFAISGVYFGAFESGVSITQTEYEEYAEMKAKYEKLDQIEEMIGAYYYKEVPPEDMELALCKGLFLGWGDRYSGYLTAYEYESMQIQTSGILHGIGVTMRSDEENNITVIAVSPDSPADNAGFKIGDIIFRVDGEDYDGTKIDEAASAMRGNPGTRVTVTYSRDGVIMESTLTRANIVNVSVQSSILDNNIGYIQIAQFETNTGEDFVRELRDLEMKGVSGVIIDLRNNGGGIVESGLIIADTLLPEGTITYLEDKNGTKTFKNSDASCTKIPYVILVNQATASTSEILASAVQDNEGGKIVGTKTFGKGVVQQIFPLEEGDAVKLTVMQYFSPNGNEIHGVGITPDFIVENIEGDSTDYQMEKAIEILNS